MKSEHDIFLDYCKLENLMDALVYDEEIKKSFGFRFYILNVRWEEFKQELFKELEKLFFWRNK